MIGSIVLLAYAAGLILLGAVVSRRARGSGDFYVAGRGLGAGLVFSTLLAANIGAGSTVGATGLGYRDGLSAWWWVGSAGIGSAILACLVGPRVWRIAREHNLYTVGDFLEFRFNRRVRTFAAVLLWFGSLSILAGQFIAVALILNVTLGFSKPLGCGVAAVVTTAYFTVGGLHSSARVNVVQLAVKLIGFALAFAYLCWVKGPWDWLRAGATQGMRRDYFSPAGIGASEIARYVFMLAPSFIVSPGILQKVFGARDAKAVRAGVGFNAAGLLLFAIIPPVLGVIARHEFPSLPNSELALPTLLLNSLPLWLGGLMLGAIFSAELSAADAGLFMLTTSLSRDLYQTYLQPRTTEHQLMRVVRATAVGCGAAAAIIGVILPTVISALTIFYTLLTAALFLPVLTGAYSTRASGSAALIGMVASVAATFATETASRGRGLWNLPSLVVGVSTGAVAMAFALFVSSRRKDSKSAKGREDY